MPSPPTSDGFSEILIGTVASLFLILVAVVKWIQGRYAAEVAELRAELKEARDALKKATDEKVVDRERVARLEERCEVIEERAGRK